MKIDSNANIYDIDGNLISKAGKKNWTIEEVEALVDSLRKKSEENPDNKMYEVYMSNAYKYLMHMYSNMSHSELLNRLNKFIDAANKSDIAGNTAEDGSNAGDNKNIERQDDGDVISVERAEDNIPEWRPDIQGDILGEQERVDAMNDVFDEYEEVKE